MQEDNLAGWATTGVQWLKQVRRVQTLGCWDGATSPTANRYSDGSQDGSLTTTWPSTFWPLGCPPMVHVLGTARMVFSADDWGSVMVALLHSIA